MIRARPLLTTDGGGPPPPSRCLVLGSPRPCRPRARSLLAGAVVVQCGGGGGGAWRAVVVVLVAAALLAGWGGAAPRRLTTISSPLPPCALRPLAGAAGYSFIFLVVTQKKKIRWFQSKWNCPVITYTRERRVTSYNRSQWDGRSFITKCDEISSYKLFLSLSLLYSVDFEFKSV